MTPPPLRWLDRIGSISVRGAVLLVFLVAWNIANVRNYILDPSVTRKNPIGFDGHIEIANNLAHGNGFVFEPGGHKVIHRPPVYVSLLAPGTLLPQKLWRLYAAALNALALAITAGFIVRYARPIFGPRVMAIAFLFLGFHPFILARVKVAHPAIVQMFIYTAILVASWRLWDAWSKGRPISFLRASGYGALLLVGALTHGTMIAHAALFLMIFGVAALVRRDWLFFGKMVVSGATFILLLAPWTYRNYKVTNGMFIPVVGNSGLAYFSGNARWGLTKPGKQANETLEQIELRHMGLPSEHPDELVQFRGFKSLENEKYANALAKQHLKEHPRLFAEKIALNAIDYYFPIIYYIRPPTGGVLAQESLKSRLLKRDALLMLAISALNVVIVGFALAGARWLARERATRLMAIVALLAWAAYAVPYFPFLSAGNDQIYTFGTLPIVGLLLGICLFRPERKRIAEAIFSE
jgi:hypothetical protein